MLFRHLRNTSLLIHRRKMIDGMNDEVATHILNELIERIVVHEKVIGPDGVKTQQVDIYYKFIGLISPKAEGGCSGEVTRAAHPQENRSA